MSRNPSPAMVTVERSQSDWQFVVAFPEMPAATVADLSVNGEMRPEHFTFDGWPTSPRHWSLVGLHRAPSSRALRHVCLAFCTHSTGARLGCQPDKHA